MSEHLIAIKFKDMVKFIACFALIFTFVLLTGAAIAG